MTRLARQRLHTLLRSIALVVLVLCLVVQPVLAAWGQMHELTAHPDSMSMGNDHGAVDSDIAASEGQNEDVGDPIHTLAHHAHCCGQPQLSLLPHLALPTFGRISTMRWVATTQTVAPSHFATPFRPPILD